jgi:hypothetical protein
MRARKECSTGTSEKGKNRTLIYTLHPYFMDWKEKGLLAFQYFHKLPADVIYHKPIFFVQTYLFCATLTIYR